MDSSLRWDGRRSIASPEGPTNAAAAKIQPTNTLRSEVHEASKPSHAGAIINGRRPTIPNLEVLSVFDAAYFRTGLPSQLEAAGAEPSVEIHLVNGQAHRVRSLVEAADGYAVLEVYQRRAEMTGSKANWHGALTSSNST